MCVGSELSFQCCKFYIIYKVHSEAAMSVLIFVLVLVLLCTTQGGQGCGELGMW